MSGAATRTAYAVTGGSGFIGLNLIEALLARGERVLAHSLDGLPAAARTAFAGLPGTLHEAVGDVRDAGIAELLREHRVGHLFHGAVITAAEARERRAPRDILDVNVLGTVGVLEACVAAGVERVALASSSAAYGPVVFEGRPVQETDCPRPATLYGVGKLAIEGIGQRFEALHGLRVGIARITAVYGPWERDTGLRDTLSAPWQIAGKAVRGEPVRLLRGGSRDWVHAATAAEAILALLDRPVLAHRIYNVAPGRLWHPSLFCESLARLFGGFDWGFVDSPSESNIQLNDDLSRERQPLAAGRMLSELVAAAPDVQQAAEDYARWVATNRGWFA